jgi:hypothetical protein
MHLSIIPTSSVKLHYESTKPDFCLIQSSVSKPTFQLTFLHFKSVLLPKPPKAVALPWPACRQHTYFPLGCDLLAEVSSLFDAESLLHTLEGSAEVVSSLHVLSSVDSAIQT